jgi:hypothetical protein
MLTAGVLLGDVVAGRYLVTGRLGTCARTVIAAGQSLPHALADHGTPEVILRVFVGNSARERAAFARAAQADPHILDFGHLDDGRLYSATKIIAC